MLQNTPTIKVDAVRGFGGEVLLHDANFDEAKAKAVELAEKKHMTFITPFDHPLVIAGQGTLAMEMLQQVADLDYMFVQVCDGGSPSIVPGDNPLIKRGADGISNASVVL